MSKNTEKFKKLDECSCEQKWRTIKNYDQPQKAS
jgi:hypothetical protein